VPEARKLRPFVLYSLWHTFLTRLGESGCDFWTLARITGHSSVAVSGRTVHPSEDKVLEAISRLAGHNSADTRFEPQPASNSKLLAKDIQ
jgi:integrase